MRAPSKTSPSSPREACSGPLRGLGSRLQGGGAAHRSALIRFWMARRLLLGGRAVQRTHVRCVAEAPQGHSEWVVALLEAVAAEATDYLELLRVSGIGWRTLRRPNLAAHGDPRGWPSAVDVLAATPLLSATTLARTIGISGQARDRVALAIGLPWRTWPFGVIAPLGAAARPFGRKKLPRSRSSCSRRSRGYDPWPGRPRRETHRGQHRCRGAAPPPPCQRSSGRPMTTAPRRGHRAFRCGGQMRPGFARVSGAESPS